MYAQRQGPGDAGEFGDLYRRYRARLVRYCGRRLGNESEAEDAAHEAMLRALQAWSRFDRAADPWPWLATIAARVCADMRRRSARVPAADGHAVGADVHDQAVGRLRASIIDDALRRLPARYRNPLVLKEYAGWSYRDIAELEGTTVASVRSNMMRSRRHLGVRVEELARTRGQWPLPAAVPQVARRVREGWQSWRQLAARGRRGLARMADPATVFTGLVLAMQPLGAGAAMGTATTVAAIGVVAAGIERADAPAVVPRETTGGATTAVAGEIDVSTASATMPASAPASASAVTGLASSRETLTRIEPPDGPVRAVSIEVGVAAEVQTSQRAMWVRTDVEVHTPLGSESRHRRTNLPCGPSEHDYMRPACTAASDALRPLPGG